MIRIIKTEKKSEQRVFQGDVFREVEYIEDVSEQSGTLKISKIIFPLVIVLTQDCDLLQN